MESLPVEVWVKIATRLSPQSLARLAQTCLLLRTVCSDESVWKLLGDKDVYAKAFAHFWRLRARTLFPSSFLDEAIATTWWTSIGAKAMRELLFPYCIKIVEVDNESAFVIMSKNTIWSYTLEQCHKDVWKCVKYTTRNEEFLEHETVGDNIARRSNTTWEIGWVHEGVNRLCLFMLRILNERLTRDQVWQINPFLI